MAAPKIIILSDGTGNAASSVWRTNVWRFFQSLDLRSNDQAAKYDDGVGTSSFLPLAILGGAFGYGLKRNILDAYKFICRNYDHANGSKIYLLGFSRGAFTVRVLAALILEQGLVRAATESELQNGAVKVYRAYRAQGYHSIWRIEVIFRALRDYLLVPILDTILRRKSYSDINREAIQAIEFIGVWDTVAAYGMPIDEMTRGISNWVWPLELPDRILSKRVNVARHALALDDERTTFHPVLWTEQQTGDPAPTIPATIDGQKLVQVWFVGMHANVGGGYPDDAVAFVPLYWILEEARKCGLTFKVTPDADPDSIKWIRSSEDKDGRLYDSRAGLGAYYRYGPRPVYDLCNDKSVGVNIPIPKIHDSVFGRIDSGCNSYAPIGLPPEYAVVVGSSGAVTPLGPTTFETPDQAKARYAAQERLWNFVWFRRLAYFATLAASFHLAAFWLFHDQNKTHEFDTKFRMVSEAVRFIESFLPRSVHWWTDWYAGNPEWFAGGIIALAVLMGIGTMLNGQIKDGMRIIWESRGSVSAATGLLHKAVYVFRTNWFYRGLINLGKRHLLPLFLAAAMVWYGATALSHLSFNIADSMGAFCEGTAAGELVAADKGIPQEAKAFDTSSICAPTGLSLRAGFKYELFITPTSPWLDDDRPVTPSGYRTSTIAPSERWKGYTTIFLRRIMFRPWFRLIARIGETGVDEYFLDPVPVPQTTPQTYRATFTAQRGGELFLYVNDAVIGLPWLNDHYYKRNHGTAKVTVHLL